VPPPEEDASALPDFELAELVDVWPTLSADIRYEIRRMAGVLR
jgi:hypothetical protein